MLPSERSLTGKNLLPRGANYFPLEKTSFQKGIDMLEKSKEYFVIEPLCGGRKTLRRKTWTSAAYLPP